MANRLGILQTKLHRPYVTDDFVSRERLLDQLNKQPRRPLTLVSAPAGYGKSTLVSGWREMCESPTAWLSLDEDDNDLARFLQYFVAAVESIHEGACPVTASLLEARTRLKPSVFAQTLLNELDQIQTPYALVLDDYNQIQQSEIHTFVGELIQYPPRSLHLVLVTRRDPPISLHLLRAHGKLVEIRAQDLRFTASETDTFLHNVLGQQIDVDTVTTLTEKTEGWVTGLRLATLSLHQFDSINALSTQLPQDARFVTDYLLAEVFERLPTDVQNFLLKTSILDWLCGPLCDAVVAMDEPERNGKAYLDWLHRQNLFTIPLDDRREWYRYHHLFQRLLRLQLRNTMANCIPTLHNRASDWFARNGLIDEALHHALASGDDLSVVRLVEENRHTPLNDDRWYVLQRWLDHIPGQLVEQRPALLMARAWIVSYLGTLWTLPPILESVKQLGQLEGLEQDLLGELRFFEGVVRFWDREVLHSRMLFREALDLMSTKHVGARNEAEIYYAVASQMTGDSAAVVASFLKEVHQERRYELRQIRLLSAIIFVHLLEGDLFEAEQIVLDVEKRAAQTRNRYVAVWISYLQGYIHYAWNNIHEACHHFAGAMQDKHLMGGDAPIDNFAGLIYAYQASGQSSAASAALQRLQDFAQQSTNPQFIGLSRSVQARVSLLQGDLESATRWMASAEPSADTGNLLFMLEVPRITECRVLIAQGTAASLEEATEKLCSHMAFAEETHNVSQLIGIQALLALAYLKQNRLDDALCVLNRAVALARPGGWIRPFVDAGPELVGPLQRIGQDSMAFEFVEQIIAGYSEHGPQTGDYNATGSESKDHHPPAHTGHTMDIDKQILDTLTFRELEVLGLLARRLANKEIAAELGVSVSTVKKHSANIYQKLDVHNRRQAVRKAVTTGILPPQNALKR